MLKLFELSSLVFIIGMPIFTWCFITNYNLDFTNSSPFKTLLRRDFTAFTCWLSCSERAAILCFYIGYADTGNASRPTYFTLDKTVDKKCQQNNTEAYSNSYDRGHLVAANHMDQSDVTIKESMQMTNILPQTSILNQQAWLRAEDIFECYRDLTNLNTIVGIIMGNDTSNDIFLGSHAVRTPDYFWRIIEKKNGDVIAWIMPNDNSAKRDKLNDYLVSIKEIERRSGFKFNGFNSTQRNKVASESWPIPSNCDKS